MNSAVELKREVWIDWMRIAACFLVMIVHSTEPFYLGGDGSLILTKADAFWPFCRQFVLIVKKADR